MSMEIASNYNNYTDGYAQEQRVRRQNGKESADNLLKELSERFDNCSFIAADYKKGMRYGTTETTNIAISPAFLKKMAQNPELQKEYESYFNDMQRLDIENIQSHAERGRRIVAQGWAIDKNGGISKWGISEPTNVRHVGQETSEYIANIREKLISKRKEEKKKAEKADKDKRAEQTTTNTDKVDSEIEKLKAEQEKMKQALNTADESEQEDVRRRLSELEQELSRKDTDSYRRQHARVTIDAKI